MSSLISLAAFLTGIYLAHRIHSKPPEPKPLSAGDRLVQALVDLNLIKPKKP